MQIRLTMFLSLALLYLLHDRIMSSRFKRRYGKAENFLGKNAPNEIQRFFGRAVYLTMIYYLLVFIYLITGFTFWGLISTITLLDGIVFQLLGFSLGLLFLLLMTKARFNLGSSWRIGLDRNTADYLVTTGFYRYVRNPYFFFLMGFQFSLILVVPNAVMLFSFIQSLLLFNLQVREEEQFLFEKYGDDYSTYQKDTGRFFPRLRF
ncbi:MAG: isoprenylcysteine carboxylmethyltransferase family protein [Firmicutes bacterium]|nr:isoprenylcysteine carboxylmethyltransferase family protein [Bacillota bacterium]